MKMSDFRSLQDLPFPLPLMIFTLGGGRGVLLDHVLVTTVEF